MSDPTAFITLDEIRADLTAETVARLGIINQHLVDSCSAVVSLIRGTDADWPAVIPYEWKRLARRHLASVFYQRFPEYFRSKYPSVEEVEREIATRARTEPNENRTYVRSDGNSADAWDAPAGSGCPC